MPASPTDTRLARYRVAFATILRKEIRRFLRIWTQTLLPPAITTTLYMLIFGNLIGERIGTMGGYAYIDFIVPGVIMLAVITSSYANTVSSFYGTKFQRYIEELLVSPVPNWLILAGYVGGGVARGLGVGCVVTLVAFAFTDLAIHNAFLTLLVALLTATLFSTGGLINAIYADSFDDISIVPTFVLTPLTYLGGIFYSIDLLPGFWQSVSLANPILYMINAFRHGILGVSDIDLATALGIIVLFVAGLAGWALILLRKGTGIKS